MMTFSDVLGLQGTHIFCEVLADLWTRRTSEIKISSESIGMRFARQQDPLPYMVSQPLPWQVHSVSHSRRSSKADEFDGFRRNSIGVYRKNSNASNGTCNVPAVPPLSPVEVEKAAATIQTHFRKFQQKKQKNGK